MKKILICLIFLFLFSLASCDEEVIGVPTKDEYQINLHDELSGNTSKLTIIGRDYLEYSDLPVLTDSKHNFIGWSFLENSKDVITEESKYHITTNTNLYSIWEENEAFYMDYFKITSVGKIYLEVNKSITSKETYVTGTLKANEEEYQLDDIDIKIRLRGNSSLGAPKKSYKIKFSNKTSFFNMPKAKDWALIANYFDCSLMRNYYAYRLAVAMGMEYAVECKFVEVYLNNNYQGLYLLCETVESGSNRVDIETDYDSTVKEIPFLVELDYKMISDQDIESVGVLNRDYFILDNTKKNNKIYPIATKYPETYTTNDITTEQYRYIREYIQYVFDAIGTEYYDKAIDVNSAIDFFLIQELFMNIDVDYSSVFMYKKVNEPLKFGPVWDFDISSGNCNYVNNYKPTNLMKNVNGGSYFLNTLIKNPEFKALFLERLNEISELILPALYNSFDYNYEILKPYSIKDDQRWNTLKRNYWPKPANLVGISYFDQVIFLKRYLQEHAEYMKNNI